MGIKTPKNHPKTPTVTPDVTSSTPETSIPTNCGKRGFFLSIDTTLGRGPLLGVLKPVWIKTTESEERVRWLQQMISKKLLMRDIEAFLKSTSE